MKKNLLKMGALVATLALLFAACSNPASETEGANATVDTVWIRLFLDRQDTTERDLLAGDSFQIKIGDLMDYAGANGIEPYQAYWWGGWQLQNSDPLVRYAETPKVTIARSQGNQNSVSITTGNVVRDVKTGGYYIDLPVIERTPGAGYDYDAAVKGSLDAYVILQVDGDEWARPFPRPPKLATMAGQWIYTPEHNTLHEWEPAGDASYVKKVNLTVGYNVMYLSTFTKLYHGNDYPNAGRPGYHGGYDPPAP